MDENNKKVWMKIGFVMFADNYFGSFGEGLVFWMKIEFVMFLDNYFGSFGGGPFGD